MKSLLIKLFLRLSISLGFFSAVADRFGLWAKRYSAWGNWSNFEKYTAQINPWCPEAFIPFLATVATSLEILFGIGLLIGYKTEFFAKLSGILLLIFALAMTFSGGVKSALDASVFIASAAAFALSTMTQIKVLEIDNRLKRL